MQRVTPTCTCSSVRTTGAFCDTYITKLVYRVHIYIYHVLLLARNFLCECPPGKILQFKHTYITYTEKSCKGTSNNDLYLLLLWFTLY